MQAFSKLIIGLGNPGEKYQNNRHNVGKLFVRGFGEIRGFRGLETNCFMNESGKFVKKYKGEELFIAHDDLDLKLGEFKINFGKGPELHNGILSIEEALGTKDFWRIRIGVDNRTEKIPGETYVLSDFTPEEKRVLEEVFPKITRSLDFARDDA